MKKIYMLPVTGKKIYDLEIEEIQKINPDEIIIDCTTEYSYEIIFDDFIKRIQPWLEKNNKFVIGINFEGGKIIKHIKQYKQCIGYVNCQIAMDAPYHVPSRIANNCVRSNGRSESQFKYYKN